jgi:hypothetical protein
MASEPLGWSMLGLNFSILILLLLKGLESWVCYMAVLSNCLTFTFIAASLTFRDVIDGATESDEKRAQRAEAGARKEAKMMKVEALLEEHKRLSASFNYREEEYAIAEASLRTREAHIRCMEDFGNEVLREQDKEGRARLDHLLNQKSRRNLRLQRIWLDIGKLKRETGAWNAWWYTS